MPRFVRKYRIPTSDSFTLDLDEDAIPLTVQLQGGEPYLWILTKSSSPDENRRATKFFVFGTDQEIPDDVASYLTYINTFQIHSEMPALSLVFHVFEYIN
jgi:hypothetical protein